MANMSIGKNGINLIKEFEGCYLTSYKCPAGVWTIGYGTTEPINGKAICAGMKITQQQADDLLRKNLKSYENAVNSYTKVSLNQNQFDALVSFTYNCGCGAYKTSTLLKKLNAGNYKGAADELLLWDKCKGKTLAGLTRRRKAERKLFLTAVSTTTATTTQTASKTDSELMKAVDKIIESGVKINATSWNSVDKISLVNVPALLSKLGGIEKLIEKGIIDKNTSYMWKGNAYTKTHVRCLLVKYASKI